MHQHLPNPSDCAACHRLHRLTVTRLRLLHSKVPVLSWCRKCGLPALLEVVCDYEFAKRQFYAIDDTAMSHKNVHGERGGWGVMWRFDEVLTAVFGDQHREECWPRPPWFEHNESEGLEVKVLSAEDLNDLSRSYIDVELRMLSEFINREPRTPDEIRELLALEEVWDHESFARQYEVLGFKEPFAIVVKKSTGQRGSVLFQHHPRYYFSFDPDRVI